MAFVLSGNVAVFFYSRESILGFVARCTGSHTLKLPSAILDSITEIWALEGFFSQEDWGHTKLEDKVCYMLVYSRCPVHILSSDLGLGLRKQKWSFAAQRVTALLGSTSYLAKEQTLLTDLVRAGRRVKAKALSIRIFLMIPGLLMGSFLKIEFR